jgi:CRP/FNR family cyclic AMP-dependent transcriptional regulator
MSSLWKNIFKGKKKNSDDPRQILQDIPIFKDLSGGGIREIERIVHVRKYETGEFVFQQGDVGAGLFVIAKGSVNILLDDTSETAPLATLEKSDFFGELSLLDNERRSASARAAEPSVLIGFFRPDLLDLVERNPVLGSKVLLNIAKVIGERLRSANAHPDGSEENAE